MFIRSLVLSNRVQSRQIIISVYEPLTNMTKYIYKNRQTNFIKNTILWLNESNEPRLNL